MKKLAQALAVFIVLLLVVFGVGSLLLHIFLPPEKAKALVLKQLTSRLKREVEIGTVSIGLFSGLSVSDLRISEARDFSKGTFLSSDQFAVRISLPPLLMKKIVVRQIVLKHPVVSITRFADGTTFNFSDLLNSSTTTSPAPTSAPSVGSTPPATSSAKEPPFVLLVSKAEVDQGVIHFKDESPAKQSIDLDPVNLAIKNVSLVSPFGIRGSVRAIRGNASATLDLNGEANLAAASFKIKSCTVTSGDSALSLSGRATDLRSPAPKADLSLDIKAFNPLTLKPFLQLPPELRVSGSVTGKATLRGDQASMAFTALLDGTKPDIAYGKSFSKPAKTPLALAASGQLDRLETLRLQSLQAVLGGLRLSGHGTVQSMTTAPNLQMHFETNSFPVQELLKWASASLPPDVQAAGTAHASADVTGPTSAPQFALKLDGRDMALSKADQFSKPAGTPLQLAAIGDSVQSLGNVQTITLQTLSGVLGPMTFQGNATVRSQGQSTLLTAAIKTNSFPLQEFSRMVPMLATYKPSGIMSLDAKASGSTSAPIINGDVQLQDVAASYQQSALTALRGNVHFTQQDVATPSLTGKLNGSDFSLKVNGHQLMTHPDVALDGKFASLDLDKLLPPPAATKTSWFMNPLVAVAWAAEVVNPKSLPMNTSGHLTVGNIKHQVYQAQNMDFTWKLTDLTPELDRVSGTAVFKQAQGIIQNAEKLASMSSAIRIVLSPILALQKIEKLGFLKAFRLPSFERVPFNSIVGDYALKLGLLDIKQFDLSGHDLSLNTRGRVGLAGEQNADMKISVKLAAGAIGGTLGQIFQDDSGRPTISFGIAGPLSHPEVRPDLQDAGRKAAQRVGDLLNGLGLGGRSQGSGSSAGSNVTPSQDKSSNPAADDLQKALKGIFH